MVLALFLAITQLKNAHSNPMLSWQSARKHEGPFRSSLSEPFSVQPPSDAVQSAPSRYNFVPSTASLNCYPSPYPAQTVIHQKPPVHETLSVVRAIQGLLHLGTDVRIDLSSVV